MQSTVFSDIIAKVVILVDWFLECFVHVTWVNTVTNCTGGVYVGNVTDCGQCTGISADLRHRHRAQCAVRPDGWLERLSELRPAEPVSHPRPWFEEPGDTGVPRFFLLGPHLDAAASQKHIF